MRSEGSIHAVPFPNSCGKRVQFLLETCGSQSGGRKEGDDLAHRGVMKENEKKGKKKQKEGILHLSTSRVLRIGYTLARDRRLDERDTLATAITYMERDGRSPK